MNLHGNSPAPVRIIKSEHEGGIIVAAALFSVVLSTLLATRALTPVLHTAAIFPFFYAAQRRQDDAWAATIVIRWMLALLIGTMIAGAFAPDRVAASVPFGESAIQTMRLWLSESGAAPASLESARPTDRKQSSY